MPLLPPPSLLAATRALLALRFHITRRTIELSPAGQAANILSLVLVCPAAWQIGGRAARLMTTAAPAEAFPAVCAALLLLTLLYVALLLAGNGGLGGVMEPPPATVLRALPVPSGATLLADSVSFAGSLPTLFFAVAVVPLSAAASGGGRSTAALILLGMFALCLALLLGRLGTLVSRRGRTGAVLIAALLVLGGVVLRAAPAAALSSVIEDAKPPVRLPWDPPPPLPPTMPPALRNTPPGLAARCLTAGGDGGATTALLALALSVALTATGVVLLGRAAGRGEPASDAKPNRRRNTVAPRQAGSLVTEVRLLARDPSAHMALRGPAGALLAMGYAWIAPNLGPDAVRNLGDLLGMGVTLYLAVWQTQFVCDRFGSEAGHAATLFSLPRKRWQTLGTKNVALFASLFALDGAVLAGFAANAGNPRLIPTLLLGLFPVLLLLTALGNVVSVLAAFPLPRKTERFEREPDRSLMFVYAAVGVGTYLLFVPVLMLGQAWGIAGYALGAGYVAAVYAASVWLVARLLTPAREQKLISLLDGIK